MIVVEKYREDGFPMPDRDNQRIPKEEKRQAKYCKEVAMHVYSQYVRGGCSVEGEMYTSLSDWRRYAYGRQSQEKYKDTYLGKVKETGVLPIGVSAKDARKAYANIDFSIMSPAPRILDAIISRMTKAVDVVSVDAIDAASGAEKETLKWGTFVEGRFKEQLSFIRMYAGLPQEDVGYVPQNVEELNLYDAEGGFKQEYVVAMEELLKYAMDESRWDENIVQRLLFDLCVGGFAMTEDVYNPITGEVKAVYCDPLYSGLQYTRDAQYDKPDWGFTVRFEKITTLRQKLPNATELDLYTAAKKYENKFGNHALEDWSKYTKLSNSYSLPYDDMIVPVIHVKWIDVEYDIDVKHINRVGHTRTFPYEKGMKLGKRDEKVVGARRKMLYEVSWVIDTDYTYDYGVARFQPRDGLSEPILPFHGVKTLGQPIMPRIIPALDLFQNAWLKLQQGISMAVLSGYSVDLSTLNNLNLGGQKLNPLEAIKMWRQTGIAFYNGRDSVTLQQGMRRPIEPLMGGAGTVINDALLAMEAASKMIEDTTGINPITIGGTPSDRQGKAVTQFAVEGTNDVLSGIVRQVGVIQSDTARSMCLRLAYVCVHDKTAFNKYKNVIGETRMELLKIADGHDVRYGIRTHTRPTDAELQEIFEAINLSLKNGRDGKVGITEADSVRFKSMVHSGASLKRVAQLLAFANKKAKEEAEAEANRAQQMNAQLNQQTEQMKTQLKGQEAQMDIQVDVSKNRSKAIGDLLVKAYEKGDKSIDDALSMLGVAPQQQTTQERENPALEAAPTAEPQQPEQASNIPS